MIKDPVPCLWTVMGPLRHKQRKLIHLVYVGPMPKPDWPADGQSLCGSWLKVSFDGDIRQKGSRRFEPTGSKWDETPTQEKCKHCEKHWKTMTRPQNLQVVQRGGYRA